MTIKKYKTQDLYIALIASNVLILVGFAFFPILSYFLSVLCLIVLNAYSHNPLVRWYFIVSAILSLSIVYLSRDFSDELNHDLSRYYDEYLKISNDDKGNYNIFGGGLEIGYHYLYGAVATFIPSLSSINLAFANFIIVIFMFFLWLELFIFRDEAFKPDSNLICGLSIIFIGFVTFGYLQRQSLAFVILLYALSSKGVISIVFFTLLSTFFHLTALPIIVFYLLIRKVSLTKPKMVFVLTLTLPALLLLRVFFYEIVNVVTISDIDFPGISKLNFYLSSRFSILSIKDLIINILLLLMLILRWESINKHWRNIALASFTLYFVFLGIPLLSERINFILFFLYGFFAYLIFINNNVSTLNTFIFKAFFIVYLCLFCFKNVSMLNAEGYEYWSRYPFFDFEPFYYMSGL